MTAEAHCSTRDATRTSGRSWRGGRAEGEESFQRKIEYLADFGRTIGVPEVDSQVLSQVMLSVLDERWKDHLYDLDQLRNAIQYRAWGQKDPLVEYKREAFEMFEDLMHDIQSTFTERFFKIQVSAEPPPGPGAARRAPTPTPRLRRRGRTICSPGPARTSTGPMGAPARPGEQLAGAGRAGHGCSSRGRAERPLPLRLREEVQEVPRGQRGNSVGRR